MAVTRSMTRRSWSDLCHDILTMVLLQLSIVDFFAFSGTCKEWRSLARSYKKRFLGSTLPMEISRVSKYYYLQHYYLDKFKIVVPHSTGRRYVGCTFGYLILFGEKTRDFWLVNPFIGHELHFGNLSCCCYNNGPTQVRALLVYSPLMSKWVFVYSVRYSNTILFRSPGHRGCWKNLKSNITIDDIHVFQGKIYIIYARGTLLYEMILHPYPILKRLKMKNSPTMVSFSEFVSSGENLYVLGYNRNGPCRVYEINFDEMTWVPAEKTIAGEALFFAEFKSGVALKPGDWVQTENERCVHFRPNKNQPHSPFNLSKWYFLNECVNDNRLCK